MKLTVAVLALLAASLTAAPVMAAVVDGSNNGVEAKKTHHSHHHRTHHRPHHLNDVRGRGDSLSGSAIV
jgi:Ni/Co efflux regulator RcnB